MEIHEDGPAAPVEAASFSRALSEGSVELLFFYVPASGFAYREGDELKGVTVELLRDFARFLREEHDLDARVRWVKEPSWAEFYDHVRSSSGAVFGVGNVTITEERALELDFSPPYLNNVAALITHRDAPELESLDDLGERFAGFRALIYPGTLHEARVESLRARYAPDLEVAEVQSNDELLAELAADPEAFGYIDVYNYWRAVQAGAPLSRHSVGDDASETFGVILPHDSDWTPALRAFFERDGGYPQSERFAEIMRRHLGDELASMLSVP